MSKFSQYLVIDHRDECLKEVSGRERRPALQTFLSEQLWGKYNDLPFPENKILATYIWVDGTGEHLRSKDRTLEFIPKVPKDKFTRLVEKINDQLLEEATKDIKWSHAAKYLPPYFCPKNLEKIYKAECNPRASRNKDSFDENLNDLPIWSYDGAGTHQAHRLKADLYLVPRAIYKDPFRRGNHILVMCDTYKSDKMPTFTNHRVKCYEAYDKCKETEPWFGIDQEYFLLNSEDLRPFGWPERGGFPMPQGRYYCGVGADKVFARELTQTHYKCCLYAGVPIAGTNPRRAPSQWEYQVGPSLGVNAGDDVWVSRYIMNRLAEEYGVVISLDPKPVVNWSGSGAHTKFSTKCMREENGIIAIEKSINKLSKEHKRDIKLYDPHDGKDNARRLTGDFETACFSSFSTGIGDRSSSISIPRAVHDVRKGYMEDRRPGSNSDPYSVVTTLMRTCILNL